MAEKWHDLDRLVTALQASIQRADQRLAEDASGGIRYSISGLRVAMSVELQVDDETQRSTVRVPRLEELAGLSEGSVARLTFDLRPTPTEQPQRPAPEPSPDEPRPVDRIRELLRQLEAPQARVRVQAAQLLGEMGPQAREAEPLLRAALNDRSRAVQEAAAKALEMIAARG